MAESKDESEINLSVAEINGDDDAMESIINSIKNVPSLDDNKNKNPIVNDFSQPSSSVTAVNYNSKKVSTINQATGAIQNSPLTFSEILSDPPTPISQQSSLPNVKQETLNVPASLAER
ncbi:unnamed protein product [Rotaria sp. Silwood2]|nr:unnamed protein product [Rotaria sp. Silwood2]